jgi:hypothetical protein
MALPPLYKYLNVEGAKLTLGNRTLKHAKPSDFNDTEDLTIQSIFPEDPANGNCGYNKLVRDQAGTRPDCISAPTVPEKWRNSAEA